MVYLIELLILFKLKIAFLATKSYLCMLGPQIYIIFPMFSSVCSLQLTAARPRRIQIPWLLSSGQFSAQSSFTKRFGQLRCVYYRVLAQYSNFQELHMVH